MAEIQNFSMVNTLQLIHQIESVNIDKLIQLLLYPNLDEEFISRAYFGDEQNERLRFLALKSKDLARMVKSPNSNVVVSHEILGGELNTIETCGVQQHLWLKLPQIVQGDLTCLCFDETERIEYDLLYDI